MVSEDESPRLPRNHRQTAGPATTCDRGDRRSFDTIIVGQGLAGTTLAWTLRWSGETVLVIDREDLVTASRVAAGLITPITGQKLVPSWRWSELWPAAIRFYDRIATELGPPVLRRTAMIRRLTTADERHWWQRRSTDPEWLTPLAIEPATIGDRTAGGDRATGGNRATGGDRELPAADDSGNGSARAQPTQGSVGSLVSKVVRSPIEPPLPASQFAPADIEFEMCDAGQLDVRRYLDQSRQHWQQAGTYLKATLAWPDDLKIGAAEVELPRLRVRARRIVFCEGAAACQNPWFRAVQFKLAQGELLTIRLAAPIDARIVHQGVWLAPGAEGTHVVGATYVWDRLDGLPTEAGRTELLTALERWLRVPFEVVGQHAAIRPIHRNQYPVIGSHPHFPPLWIFNGLGSKGALQAPFFAAHLAAVFQGTKALDRSVDVQRKTTFDATIGKGPP